MSVLHIAVNERTIGCFNPIFFDGGVLVGRAHFLPFAVSKRQRYGEAIQTHPKVTHVRPAANKPFPCVAQNLLGVKQRNTQRIRRELFTHSFSKDVSYVVHASC